MGLEVQEQGDGIEYGILIYDIPEENNNLYQLIWKQIRKKAIRLNLSVYLFKWGQKSDLESVVEKAQQDTGEYASVFVSKFDNCSLKDVQKAAKTSLIREVTDIKKRLLEAIERAKDKAKEEGLMFDHIRMGYAKQVEERINEAQQLSFLFGLNNDTKYAIESVRSLFAIEKEKIEEARAERKIIRRAQKAAKNAKSRLMETEDGSTEIKENKGELAVENKTLPPVNKTKAWNSPIK